MYLQNATRVRAENCTWAHEDNQIVLEVSDIVLQCRRGVFKNNICQLSKICYQEQCVIHFTQSEIYPFKFLLEPVFVLFLFFRYSFILECLFTDAVFCCYAPELNTDAAL